jgi:hypothetical protein
VWQHNVSSAEISAFVRVPLGVIRGTVDRRGAGQRCDA